jgi:hypothetical protein
MAKRTNEKNCFCWTCSKDFHALGIARHRKAHKVRFETCKISYTNGNTRIYRYADLRESST